MSGTAEKSRDDLGFDPDALKQKYLAERDKRLRTDGNEQYVEIAGQFAHYLEDPYIAPVARAPSRKPLALDTATKAFRSSSSVLIVRNSVQPVRITGNYQTDQQPLPVPRFRGESA